MSGAEQDAALEHHPKEKDGSWEESRGMLIGQQGKDGFDGQWRPGKALKAKISKLCQKAVFGREW